MTLWWAGCGIQDEPQKFRIDVDRIPEAFLKRDATQQFWALNTEYQEFAEELEHRAQDGGEEQITWSIWANGPSAPAWFTDGAALDQLAPVDAFPDWTRNWPEANADGLRPTAGSNTMWITGEWTWHFFETIESDEFPDGWEEMDEYEKSDAWLDLGGAWIIGPVFSETKITVSSHVSSLDWDAN